MRNGEVIAELKNVRPDMPWRLGFVPGSREAAIG